MAGFTASARETAALAVTGMGNWISLHTTDPGITGAAEASGGAPAYARKQTTWAGGAVDGSVPGSQVTFDAPAGTYGFASQWTASTAGTFISSWALNTPAVLSGQGQVLVTPTIAA